MSTNLEHTLVEPFTIYRANKAGNGAASQFTVKLKKNENNTNEVQFFWTMAKQAGEKKFDWQNKNASINFKMGVGDMCDMIAVIGGRKTEVGPGNGKGRFHENPKGNTVLKFAYNKEKNIYQIGLSSKRENQENVSLYHSLSIEEAMGLLIVLQDAVSLSYNWKSVKVWEKKS